MFFHNFTPVFPKSTQVPAVSAIPQIHTVHGTLDRLGNARGNGKKCVGDDLSHFFWHFFVVEEFGHSALDFMGFHGAEAVDHWSHFNRGEPSVVGVVKMGVSPFYMVSQNSGIPESSILGGLAIMNFINHPFLGSLFSENPKSYGLMAIIWQGHLMWLMWICSRSSSWCHSGWWEWGRSEPLRTDARLFLMVVKSWETTRNRAENMNMFIWKAA